MALSNLIKVGESTILQRRISEVAQDVFRMGALVEDSFRYCHRALFAGEVRMLTEIIKQDQQIDRYYKKIELECAKVMTLQAPVAQDLRTISGFMQLVRDLERIGDYAEDLAHIATKLIIYPPHDCLKEIELMSKQAQLMLAKSMVALSELDGNASQYIKILDNTVDDLYQHLYETLAYQENVQGVIEPTILLTLVIRNLERMADHATNIADRVTYIVTGSRS